jgi:hypothetical protein
MGHQWTSKENAKKCCNDWLRVWVPIGYKYRMMSEIWWKEHQSKNTDTKPMYLIFPTLIPKWDKEEINRLIYNLYSYAAFNTIADNLITKRSMVN